MSKVVVGMTISVDGFICDAQGRIDALYPDFESFVTSDYIKQSIAYTGAVVMGKNAFAMADDPDSYAVDYEYQVPIFVLTHHIPSKKPRENDLLTITFVSEGIESAVAQAKLAAGAKDVTVVGGARTIQQCLQAGLADELHVDIMPVLLGNGLRLFDNPGLGQIQLTRLEVISLPAGRTHISYRIEK